MSLEPHSLIDQVISFSDADRPCDVTWDVNEDDPDFSMVLTLKIANFKVKRVLIDNGSSAKIISSEALDRMNLQHPRLDRVSTPLIGFGGSKIVPLGTIILSTT